MGHAVKKRLLASNPTKDALGQTDYIPARAKQREHVYLTMPQLMALAKACDEFELFVMVAGTCGLHWGEITALTYEDLDLGDKPAMTVRKAFSEIGRRLVLGPTKGGESRVVPLPALVAGRLKVAAAAGSPGARVFSTGISAPEQHMDPSPLLPRHRRAAGQDDQFPAPHFPRPPAHCRQLGDQLRCQHQSCPAIAGHASATMTLDTYAGLFDHDLHDSAGRLNAALERLGWE